MMKTKYALFLALLTFVFLPCHALAQPSEAKPIEREITQVQINQPFLSEQLGELTLPFMWDIAEDSGRVIAREKRSSGASVLSIDLFSIPQQLQSELLVASILASVAEALEVESPGVVSETLGLLCDSENKNCKQTLTVYTANLEALKGAAKRCAFLFVPSRGKLLTLSICMAPGREIEPSPIDVLKEVFMLMR